VNAACSGFLNALSVADSFIRTGQIGNALVVGSDALSRLLNWQDRTTCILFGDGAGAVVLEASENGRGGILSTKLRTDGSYVKTLYVPAGGSLKPAKPETVRNNEHTITMNGKEVFKVRRSLHGRDQPPGAEEAGVKIEQVSLVIPHQVIADYHRVGRPPRHFYGQGRGQRREVRQHSAASIPLRSTKPNDKAGFSAAISSF
jgi:3-oxoacyl-[acyl-carrier-protein] synthase-3